jgi:hypothetical protein
MLTVNGSGSRNQALEGVRKIGLLGSEPCTHRSEFVLDLTPLRAERSDHHAKLRPQQLHLRV